ncbi:MAG: hypothetical protein U0V48_18415 [Anaerolineales bacterium]
MSESSHRDCQFAWFICKLFLFGSNTDPISNIEMDPARAFFSTFSKSDASKLRRITRRSGAMGFVSVTYSSNATIALTSAFGRSHAITHNLLHAEAGENIAGVFFPLVKRIAHLRRERTDMRVSGMRS